MDRVRAQSTLVSCLLFGASGCQDIDRFDTTDESAYCGSIVSAQFVRTTVTEGGFQRDLRLELELDMTALDTAPAVLTTDDGADGPCAPSPTFDSAVLTPIPEISHDPLSTLTFSDTQDHNLLGWATSSCRGPVLVIVSLLKDDSVDVRLLKPAPEAPTGSERAAFALFRLSRRESCGF